jgi:hypothetical protein
MLPDHYPAAIKRLARSLLYSSESCLYCALVGLFSTDLKGGDVYLSNAPHFATSNALGRFLVPIARDGPAALRSLALNSCVLLMSIHQQLNYGQLTTVPVADACSNSAVTEGLYKWSYTEVYRHVFKNK